MANNGISGIKKKVGEMAGKNVFCI